MGLAKKDLLLTHEEGKNPQVGSGIEPVSKEEGQGDKQTGRTAAEPCLEQNKDNNSETVSRTFLQTGAGINSEKRVQNSSRAVFPRKPSKRRKCGYGFTSSTCMETL